MLNWTINKIVDTTKPLGLTALSHVMRWDSYLSSSGWFRSFRTKQAIDSNGCPIPWMSYPFISFLEPRLKDSFNVLEYGCGNSTLFFASRVKSVFSIEHDRDWFEKTVAMAPPNVTILCKPLGRDQTYSNACRECERKIDIAVVDGKDRLLCARNLLSAGIMNNGGVIIIDDTEQKEHEKACQHLTDASYRRIDFTGIGPMVRFSKTTSVFYRDNNILSI